VARVEIYVKSTCGFCFRAQKLLESKGVDYEAHELTWGSPLREEMIQRAKGRTTVPQIFIDGQHIGGSTPCPRRSMRHGRFASR